MLFNSIDFMWFLPLAVAAYYLCPARWRWGLLVAASYAFYMWWRPPYIALIVVTTVVDYWTGLQMGKRASAGARLPFLLLSLGLNLGLLITFKYLGFLATTSNDLLGTDLPVLSLLLPLGISFHTFQSVGYVVDVYRGRISAERHLGYFAAFVAYFPQMVAGPIERYEDLGPQLRQHHRVRYEDWSAGFRLMLLGFFAKMVVADNLAPLVDSYYSAPLGHGRRDAALALVAYAFQIYGDFWGYSLIATGTARLLGVRLATNFRSPYLAHSVSDYWQRWHISLTRWFRDYVFQPLSLQLRGLRRIGVMVAILGTYLLSGLWHGAQWTFVLWGGIWGLLLGMEFLLGKWLKPQGTRAGSWQHFVRAPIIFGLACLALVPFRSGSIVKAGEVLEGLLLPHAGIQHLSIPLRPLVLLLLFVLLDVAFYDKDPAEAWGRWPLPLRWASYAVLLYCILAMGAVVDVPFIYFQF